MPRKSKRQSKLTTVAFTQITAWILTAAGAATAIEQQQLLPHSPLLQFGDRVLFVLPT